MIKHIVMWTLKDETEHGTKAQAAQKMKEMLEALNGKVPTLKLLEVGVNTFGDTPPCDVVLYSEFASRADLDAYQVQPGAPGMRGLCKAGGGRAPRRGLRVVGRRI